MRVSHPGISPWLGRHQDMHEPPNTRPAHAQISDSKTLRRFLASDKLQSANHFCIELIREKSVRCGFRLVRAVSQAR
jgi:hypothetical protein